jgi:peptide/nickel transport system substrate-binding protein
MARWRMGRWIQGVAVALSVGLMATTVPAQQKVLRVVPDGDLKVLDPIFTTAGTTSSHGYMVYDVLFSEDSRFQPRPQMVESWTKSPDELTWTFRLRDGLVFHDGTPVKADDAVASLKRWGARIVGARILMQRIASVDAIGEREFVIRLKEKYPPLISTLANSDQPLFVMRKAEANTDPNTAVTTVVGSGPFIFKQDEWRPGQRVVYVRNPSYRPRSELADGYAGGKVVRVDRVEWTYIPDAATAVQALIAGEVDIYELPPNDLLPLLERAPTVKLEVANRQGSSPILRPNHLIKPFDNPKVRQALLYAVDQSAVLAAITGSPDLGKPCWALFTCGTPLETNVGLGDFARPTSNPQRARELLREAGYANERIVMMHPTDQPIVSAVVQVNAARLREAGFNVAVQTMDWATMISRRPTRAHPDEDPKGWHIFHTWSPGTFWGNPLVNNAIATPCDRTNWFGWPCDEALDSIRGEFVNANTDDKRREIAGRFQQRFYQVVPYVPLGQYFSKIAYSKRLSGVLPVPRLVMWNVDIQP